MALEIQKIADLIADLAKKTAERKVTWKTTAAKETFASVVSEEYAFTVTKLSTGTCRLTLKDKRGFILFDVSQYDFQAVGNLYEDARSQALRIGERLDDVLDAIRKL